MLKHILSDINYLLGKSCSFGGDRRQGRSSVVKVEFPYILGNKYVVKFDNIEYTICITRINGNKISGYTILKDGSFQNFFNSPISEYTKISDKGPCVPLGSVLVTGPAMPVVSQKRKTLPSDKVNPNVKSRRRFSGVIGDDIRYNKFKFPDTGWPSIGTYVINNKGYIGTVINNTFIDEITEKSGKVVQEPNITIYWDFRSEFLENKKAVVKLGPSPCSGLPIEKCKNECNWTKKGCQRKRQVKIPLSDISAQDDLTNDECISQGIKNYTKSPIDKKFDIINIIPPIGIYLEILSQLDALKDFCEDKIIITDEHKHNQANIIKDNIMKICKKLKADDKELKDLLEKNGTLAQIYTELEKKLGLVVLFPFDIIKILFPGITSLELISNKFILTSYLLHYLNNEKNIIELKTLSDNYKKEHITNSKNANKNLISIINDWINKDIRPKTIAWIEATPGAQKIIETLDYLKIIADDKKLLSFISPATILDAAPVSNEITQILKDVFDSFNLDIGQKQNIILKDTDDNILIDWVIERIDDIIVNEPKYLLHIEKFFTLNCKKFGGLKVVNTKLSIQNVWNIIRDRLIDDENSDNHPNPYNDNKELYDEADLCIKANKTSMDMLKGIYAINILNKNSESGDDIDMISIFNDQNAARFFSSISSNGVTIYASKVPFESDGVTITPSRFVIKKEIISFLSNDVIESETSLHPDPDETVDLRQIGESLSDADSKPKYNILTGNGLLKIYTTGRENIEDNLKKYFSTINPYSFETMYNVWKQINGKNDNFNIDFYEFKKWYDNTQKRQSFGKTKKNKDLSKLNKEINYLNK